MIRWIRKHPDISAILLIALLSLVRFWEYYSGFVLAEPDTVIHIEIVKNLHTRFLPVYHNQGWYYGLPLYFYLAYIANLFFTSVNFSLVLVSILSATFLNVGVYWYVRRKVSSLAGIIAALCFFLSPSIIFYSRIGLIEMTVIAFSFMFLFLFDIGVATRDLKKIIASGVLLGLAILTKYTALIFALTPGIYFGTAFLGEIVRKKNIMSKIKALTRPFFYSSSTLFLGFVIPLPLVLYFINVDGWRFKLLTKATILETPEFWGKAGFHWYFSDYVPRIPLLVGSVILVLSSVGLIYIVKRHLRVWTLFLLTFLVALFFIFKRNPSPRYFVVLTPFFAILAGLGVYYLYLLVKNIRVSRFVSISMVIALLLVMIPEFQYAFMSTSHNRMITQVATYIKQQGGVGKPVFTSYWPNLFEYRGTGDKTSWLTGSAFDVGAFGTNWPEGKNSVQILKEEGGFAIIEDRYTKLLWKDMDSVGVVGSNIRREPVSLIEANYEPVKIIKDTSPNFPFFANTYDNTIKIYEIKSK